MKKLLSLVLIIALGTPLFAAEVPESRKLLIPERKVTFYQVNKAPVLDGLFTAVA